MAKITKHAYDRAKERMSISHHALDRMAGLVLDHGVKKDDTRGMLNGYLNQFSGLGGTANDTRVYGEYVYVFEQETLITVYQLPNALRRYLRLVRKRH